MIVSPGIRKAFRIGGFPPGKLTPFASASFFAPLTSNLTLSKGTGSITSSRASTATVQDFEGLTKLCKAGEARFKGSRRVENLIPTSAESNIGAGWYKPNVVATPTTFNFAANTEVYTTGVGASNLGYSPNGRVFIISCELSSSAPAAIYIGATDTQAWTAAQAAQNLVNITTTAKRYSILYTPTGAVGTIINFVIGNIPHMGGSLLPPVLVNASKWMIEDVTGQSNQNPSEYVSSSETSAGALGVKYFETTNGNTVAGNVITEAVGTPIPATTLQGALVEGAAANYCLQSTNPLAAPWALQNATSADAGVAPDGVSRVVEITVTTTATTRLFQVITAASGNYTMGVWYRCATGTVNASIGLGDSVAKGIVNITATPTWKFASTSANMVSQANVLLYANPDGDFGSSPAGTKIQYAMCQVEAGLVSTSYIPTTTAAVTRAADVLTAPTAGNLTAVKGWMYAEFIYYAGMRNWLCDSYTDASNYLGLSHASGTSVGLRKAVAGVITDAVSATALVSGTRYKLAGTWGTNGMFASLNGIALGSNASTTSAVLAPTVQLNAFQGGGEQGAGRNHRFGTTQLTQAQLNAMTA